jgi:NAT, N-acetyltransferase, of N-acetylglutamate synthase
MEPAEAVLQFLAGVGPGSEAEFYLRLFRSRARESFATIVFDPETWRQNADGVVLDLRLLATLSLTPVVVLGFYQPERAHEFARVLVAKLAEKGLASSVFASDSSREVIAEAAARGEIPLLRLDELDEEAREMELARLLASLSTHKLIFLRNEGGLLIDGRPLSVVNLSDDYSELIALPEWSAEQKRLLGCSRRLVFELMPHELLVTVTSPLSLLHELFTVRGAGTLLRRGARIMRHNGIEGVDLDALSELLQASFGKPVRETLWSRPIAHAYVEERYRGLALVSQTRLGSYLSKFGVTREAQGEGIGRDLWQAMTADHRVLFWRARANNAIRSWYEKQCDGRVRVQEWTVYWLGIPPERIPEAIAYALSQPIDF